ncbi:hypothetical protein ACFL1X_13405, partial [Candidatus Hydrogenedentota bacterium]
SLNALERDFAGSEGYPFSYTIVEFIVNDLGYAKLLQFMGDPSDFEGVFGVSKKGFEQNWHEWLKRKYGV